MSNLKWGPHCINVIVFLAVGMSYFHFIASVIFTKLPLPQYLLALSWSYRVLHAAPALLALIINGLLRHFRDSLLPELTPKIQDLSDIDPHVQRQDLFDVTATCEDLISWSQEYPEVKAYIGKVNRMGRPLTNSERLGIDWWVRENKRAHSEDEKTAQLKTLVKSVFSLVCFYIA